MQVPAIPVPVLTNALPQDAAAKAVAHTQPIAPLTLDAVNPVPKSEKSVKARENHDRRRRDDEPHARRDRPEGEEEQRGGSINIEV